VRGASIIRTRQNENLFFWGKGFFVLPRLISRPQEGVGGAGKKWKGKFLVLVPPLQNYMSLIVCGVILHEKLLCSQ